MAVGKERRENTGAKSLYNIWYISIWLYIRSFRGKTATSIVYHPILYIIGKQALVYELSQDFSAT